MKLYDSVPLRTIPANLITATAMSCGFASVYTSLGSHDLQTAAWLVLWSVLLDKLDGSVARALKGSTEFGVQFDSFADATAFGAAPAALIFGAASTLAPQTWGAGASFAGVPAPAVLGAICLVYAVMTAVRLARFNVTTAAIGPLLFLGLPSTLSGAMLCSGFLALFELGIDRSHPAVFAALPIIALVNAALMVCNLPLPKFKVSKHPLVKVVQIAIAVAVYVAVPLRVGMSGLFALVLGYLLVGFGWLGPKMWVAHQRESNPTQG